MRLSTSVLRALTAKVIFQKELSACVLSNVAMNVTDAECMLQILDLVYKETSYCLEIEISTHRLYSKNLISSVPKGPLFVFSIIQFLHISW